MTNSILNYYKNTEIESCIVNEFSDKLRYLISVRKEMTDTIAQMDEMIDEIIKEMCDAGIEIN